MKRINIDFWFKGQRDYVHGPDLYDQISRTMIKELGSAAIEDLDIRCHKFVKSGLDCQIYKNTDVKREAATAVVFSFNCQHDRYKLLLADNGKVISERRPYPEQEIVDRCRFKLEDKAIVVDSPLDFTDAEVFTAMHKALLKKLYPEITKKWVYVRMQSASYGEQTKSGSLSVTLAHNFNFKLLKSAMKIDDKVTGYIYFSLI